MSMRTACLALIVAAFTTIEATQLTSYLRANDKDAQQVGGGGCTSQKVDQNTGAGCLDTSLQRTILNAATMNQIPVWGNLCTLCEKPPSNSPVKFSCHTCATVHSDLRSNGVTGKSKCKSLKFGLTEKKIRVTEERLDGIFGYSPPSDMCRWMGERALGKAAPKPTPEMPAVSRDPCRDVNCDGGFSAFMSQCVIDGICRESRSGEGVCTSPTLQPPETRCSCPGTEFLPGHCTSRNGECQCKNKCSLVNRCPNYLCHKDVECDPGTGQCPEPTREDQEDPGTSCSISRDQTENYECHDGQCVFVDPCANVNCRGEVEYEGTCKQEPTCNARTGNCRSPKNKPSGAACNDDKPLTFPDLCDGQGNCIGQDPCTDEVRKKCSTDLKIPYPHDQCNKPPTCKVVDEARARTTDNRLYRFNEDVKRLPVPRSNDLSNRAHAPQTMLTPAEPTMPSNILLETSVATRKIIAKCMEGTPRNNREECNDDNPNTVDDKCGPRVSGSPTEMKKPWHVCAGTPKACKPMGEVEGYSTTETSLLMASFAVTVKCVGGFKPSGGGPKAYVCLEHDTNYRLEGCKNSLFCNDPRTPGYIVGSGSMRHDEFAVTATCDEATHTGTAVVTSCPETGGPFNLTGCTEKIQCVKPPTPRGYLYTKIVNAFEGPDFNVEVECNPEQGFVRADPATPPKAKCPDGAPFSDDEGEHSYFGIDGTGACIEDSKCVPPKAEDLLGYVVINTDLSPAIDKFSVTVTCDEGYTLIPGFEGGAPKATVCAEPVNLAELVYPLGEVDDEKMNTFLQTIPNAHDGSAYLLDGCEIEKRCLGPEPMDGYVIGTSEPTWQNEIVNPFFTAPGGTEWEGSPNQLKVTCDAATGYVIGTVAPNDKVQVNLCTSPVGEGTPSEGTISYYTLQGCVKQQDCKKPDTEGYKTSRGSYSMTTAFQVTVVCDGPDFVREDEATEPTATVCTEPGGDFTLAGCKKIERCSKYMMAGSYSGPPGYVITSEEVRIDEFEVVLTCDTALYKGEATAAVCSAGGEEYVLSGCEKIKKCISPAGALELRSLVPSDAAWTTTSVNGICVGACARLPLGDEPDGGLPCPEDATVTVKFHTFPADVLDECKKNCLENPQCDGLATWGKPGATGSLSTDEDMLEIFYVAIDEDTGLPMKTLQFPHDKVVMIKSMETNPAGYRAEEKSLVIDTFEVRVTCSEGYSKTEDAKSVVCPEDGEAYTLEGCSKTKTCIHPDTTDGLAVRGYTVLSQDLDMLSFAVQLECVAGFASDTGKTAEAKVCTDDGGAYTVDGCVPELCKEPAAVPTGYKKNEAYVGEKSLLRADFNAPYWSCEAPNYFRTQSVTSNAVIAKKCSQHDMEYILAGCEKSKCVAPGAEVMSFYTVKAGAVYDIADFKVELDCNVDVAEVGAGTATACQSNGGVYTVAGCTVAKVCQHPGETVRLEGAAASSETGYVVTTGTSLDLRTDQFSVTLACDEDNGYIREAVATAPVATACSGTPGGAEPGGIKYTVAGCKKGVCKEPAVTTGYVKKTGTAPPENLSWKNGFSVKTWECDGPNYMLAAGFVQDTIAAVCPAADEEYTLSGCQKAQCTPPSNVGLYDIDGTPVLYLVDFDVKATCKEEVAIPGAGTATACVAGGLPYTLDGCTEDYKCQQPPGLANNGYIKKSHTTDVLLSSKFAVQLECISPSFFGTAAKATKCPAADTPYTVEGCEKALCTSPTDFDAKGFMKVEPMTERLFIMNFHVTGWACKENYYLTRTDTMVATKCKVNGAPYTLDGCKKIECRKPNADPFYVIGDVTSLFKEDFAVAVECDPVLAAGTAVVEPCDKHNDPFKLTGCTEKPEEPEPEGVATTEPPAAAVTPTPPPFQDGACTRPQDSQGYFVTEVKLDMATFQVTATCRLGYEGHAIVKKCPVAGSPFILEGCELPDKSRGGGDPEPSDGGGCNGCGCCGGGCPCGGGGGGVGLSPQDDGMHVALDGLIGALGDMTEAGGQAAPQAPVTPEAPEAPEAPVAPEAPEEQMRFLAY